MRRPDGGGPAYLVANISRGEEYSENQLTNFLSAIDSLSNDGNMMLLSLKFEQKFSLKNIGSTQLPSSLKVRLNAEVSLQPRRLVSYIDNVMFIV